MPMVTPSRLAAAIMFSSDSAGGDHSRWPVPPTFSSAVAGILPLPYAASSVGTPLPLRAELPDTFLAPAVRSVAATASASAVANVVPDVEAAREEPAAVAAATSPVASATMRDWISAIREVTSVIPCNDKTPPRGNDDRGTFGRYGSSVKCRSGAMRLPRVEQVTAGRGDG